MLRCWETNHFRLLCSSMLARAKPCGQWPQGRFPSLVDCTCLLTRHRVIKRIHHTYKLLEYYNNWLSVSGLKYLYKSIKKVILLCHVHLCCFMVFCMTTEYGYLMLSHYYIIPQPCAFEWNVRDTAQVSHG